MYGGRKRGCQWTTGESQNAGGRAGATSSDEGKVFWTCEGDSGRIFGDVGAKQQASAIAPSSWVLTPWDLSPSCVSPSPVSPPTTSATSLTRPCRGRLPGLAAESTSSLLASADCPHGEACRRVGRPVGSSVNGRARVGALEVQREPACSTSSILWRPPRMPLTFPTATMAAAAVARGMSAATTLAATHSSPASCATDQRPAWLHSSWYDVGASAAAARDDGGGGGKGAGGLHPHRGMWSAAGGLRSVPPPPCPPAPHCPASSAIDGTIATNQTMPTDACCPAWLAGGPSSAAF